MLRRELTKGKSRCVILLAKHAREWKDGSALRVDVASPRDFDRQVQQKLEEGYQETQPSLSRRAFYQGDPESGKFWIIELEDEACRVQFGKIPSYGYIEYGGTKRVKDLDSRQEALQDYFKQIAGKLKEGYQELHPRDNEYSEPPEGLLKPPAAKKPSPKKTVENVSAVSQTGAAAEGGRREFELRDGKSEKFWAIRLDGAAHTVEFGRIGTAGQTQTKEFDSEDAAKKSCEKLIAEKTKKGYVEVTATGAVPAASAQETAKKTPDKAAVKTEPLPAAWVATVFTEVTHDLGLSPKDWYWATWRKLEPLQLADPAPFDLDDCVARMGKIRTSHYGWEWAWSDAGIPDSMAPEEAYFWFTAITSRTERDVRPRQLAKDVFNIRVQTSLTVEQARKRLEKAGRFVAPEVVTCLAHLLPFHELLELILGPFDVKSQYTSHPTMESDALRTKLITGFRERVPYLSDSQRRQVRDRVRGKVAPANDSTDDYAAAPVEFYLGAAVGLEELEAVVSPWPDDTFTKQDWSDHYRRPQLLIFGLSDAKSVEHHVRRLKLRLKSPDFIRAWLTHTEVSALDVLCDTIAAESNKDEAAKLMEVVLQVRAPEAAAAMLKLKLDSKASKQAREWLDLYVGNGITGAVAAAAGAGKVAEAAVEYLRDKKLQGHAARIEAAVQAAPAEAAEKVRREVLEREEKVYEPLTDANTPDWLAQAIQEARSLKAAKLPEWAHPATAPAVLVDGHRLNDEQMMLVSRALKHGDLARPHPLLASLREKADRGSLAALAWHLFQRWLEDGGPSKEKWAMLSLGFFGDDQAALKLTPMIRAWPGESQHPRAVTGLECLRSIGSDTALMQLNGIAQKVPFKGIKQKAMEFMEAIAKDKGMSRSELEDRIVPDCDLDERGSREFDFGPRKFRFVLGPEMKPMVADEAGKLRGDLPKPSGKDDKAKAEAAVADWKLLKKQIREVSKIQALRLEQAMVTGRTWKREDFETLLVRHPLMTNLVRLLIWGGLDAEGRLATTFRVTEEQEYADMNDEPVRLDEIAAVRIVHPLQLDDRQKSRWGEVLGDYEIIPPFSQLGRETYALEKGEEDRTEITRFAAVELPAVSLVGTLDRFGWTRGVPQDAGIFYEHSKPFFSASVTAIVQYPGVPIGYMEGWEDQKIERCFFIPGVYKANIYPDHKRTVRLGEVDPVVISEVLRDLTVVASKGK